MGNYPPTSHKVSSRKGEPSKPRRKKKLTSSSTNSNSQPHSDSGEKSIQFKKYLQNEPIPEDAPPEIVLIRQFLYDKDSQNFEGMKKVTHERCNFYFVDSEVDMIAREFYESVQDTFDSFPNLHFFWSYMRISGIDSATGWTVVKVGDYYGIGKHDGKPYAFGPYEAIPATGKICRDNPIQFTMYVKNGKIMKSVIVASGKIVGPPGFYTRLGGVIPGLASEFFEPPTIK